MSYEPELEKLVQEIWIDMGWWYYDFEHYLINEIPLTNEIPLVSEIKLEAACESN